MDVSVQYRFHASGSSSYTSFHPSLDFTVLSRVPQLLRLMATVLVPPRFLAFLDAARSISLGL